MSVTSPEEILSKERLEDIIFSNLQTLNGFLKIVLLTKPSNQKGYYEVKGVVKIENRLFRLHAMFVPSIKKLYVSIGDFLNFSYVVEGGER